MKNYQLFLAWYFLLNGWGGGFTNVVTALTPKYWSLPVEAWMIYADENVEWGMAIFSAALFLLIKHTLRQPSSRTA